LGEPLAGWLAGWLDRVVAGLPAADRNGPARPRRRGRERPFSQGQDRHRGRGGQVGLPVLRGGLRAERLRPNGKVVQIEGDPVSPVSRGRLCPKGSASLQLTTGGSRQYRVKYRRPFGTRWEDLDLDTAMDMIADRVLAARRHGWQWEQDGNRTRRTLGFASLGGATLDNEENYLIKKLFTALGAIQIENQARI
jgi:hypothetical protein